MTDLAKNLIRGLALLALVLAVWWGGDSLLELVRAPVKAELDKAVAANASVELALTQEKNLTKALTGVLADRAKREAALDRREKDLVEAFNRLKRNDPDVVKWADTPLPPGLFTAATK